MKTILHILTGLRRCVIAEPPHWRNSDLMLNDAESTRLIRLLEVGSVINRHYGRNPNLYNIAVREFPVLLELLSTAASRAVSRHHHRPDGDLERILLSHGHDPANAVSIKARQPRYFEPNQNQFQLHLT